jgi:phosphonate transport system substrate-binding protein
MDRKGMAKAADFRIILKSEQIVNSPMAYLGTLPADLKAAIKKAVLELAVKDKAAFDKIYEGKQLPFAEVDHKAYEAVIDLTKFVDSIRKQKS